MGSSFIEYREKGFWESDGWIRDLLGLLLEEFERRGLRDTYADLWRHWTVQSNIIFTGCHSVGLDEHVKDEPTRRLLIECCEAISRREGVVERRRPQDFEEADPSLFDERERRIDLSGVRPLALHLVKLLRGEVEDTPETPGALHWRTLYSEGERTP